MKKVSAVIIDTHPEKKCASLAIKMVRRLPIVENIFTFSDSPFEEIDNSHFIKIEPIHSLNEYGRVIFEQLIEVTKREHVLIFQWDGFPIYPNKWSDDFLNYDYIGAPWPHHPLTPVGNGGFSLRSKNLLQTLKDLRINIDLSNPFPQLEDAIICIHNKSILEERGISFAPVNIATKFSYENGPLNKNVFGFHGPHNFPLFFSESDLIRYAESIISRIHNPGILLEYLNRCIKLNMQELIQMTMKDFYNKPNLFKAYQFLLATNPNSELLNLFIKN